jgi:hypothetical protein
LAAPWLISQRLNHGRLGTEALANPPPAPEPAGSLDWDGDPVLRFSEVPEIEVELVESGTDVPLGVGGRLCAISPPLPGGKCYVLGIV